MSAPNLLALTTRTIDTAIALATTSVADLIAAVASGHAYSVEAVFCSNYHASTAGYITVIHKKGGTEYKVVGSLRVSAGQMLNALLGKPLYLAEGDSLRIQADADSVFVCLAPYSNVN